MEHIENSCKTQKTQRLAFQGVFGRAATENLLNNYSVGMFEVILGVRKAGQLASAGSCGKRRKPMFSLLVEAGTKNRPSLQEGTLQEGTLQEGTPLAGTLLGK